LIILAIRNSQGLERSMEFDNEFNTLKENLSFMIQRRYKDAFYKNHRPVFDVYPLDRGLRKDLREKIPNLKEEIIKDFISYFWKKVDEYMLKDIIEERLPKNETASYILDGLKEHYYEDKDEYMEKFPKLQDALEALSTFDLNIGREYGYNDGSIPYDIEKDMGKFKDEYVKEKFLKDESVFDSPLLNKVLKPNEEIIERIKNTPVDNRVDEVMETFKKVQDLAKMIMEDKNGLKETFERFRKFLEGFEGGEKIYEEYVKELGESEDIRKEMERLLGEKDLDYYENVTRLNTLRMYKRNFEPRRENMGIALLIADMMTAIKTFVGKKEERDKLLVLFILSIFGLNPVSAYFLKLAGVMEEESLN
ncbi:MAG: hypothetical protein DSY32_00040, partial [Aquifex sp.]